MKYLALIDTDRPKDYIFATNKLSEIRGASHLLEWLNREETPRLAVVHGGTVIAAGGGAALVFFDDADKAEKFCRELEKVYRDQTTTASVTSHIEPRKDGDSFYTWLTRAEHHLRMKKDGRRMVAASNHTPVLHLCESCALYPASQHHAAKPHLICESCFSKREQAHKHRHGNRAYTTFCAMRGLDVDSVCFANDFTGIGVESDPKGYIGFIYADGNRMGKHLKDLLGDPKHSGTDDDTIQKAADRLKDFSETIDQATSQALAEAGQIVGSANPVPLEFSVAGGDDGIAVVPGNCALEFAARFCREFVKQSNCKGYTFSTAVGVVIAHDSLPIFDLLDLATGLQVLAKRYSNALNDTGEVSTVDFTVITGSGSPPIETVRNESLMLHHRDHGDLLTSRPLTLTDLESLLCRVRTLKQSGFPRTKLAAMYQAMYRGRNQSQLDILYLWSRLRTPDMKIAFANAFEATSGCVWEAAPPERWEKVYGLNAFPGQVSETQVLDVIDAYDFVK